MDATQMINDSVVESDEEDNEENQTNRGSPVAKLHILKNQHMPETELPLFLGENILGRDGSTCTVPLPSPSISKQHATISVSLYRSRGEVHMEALVWDLGSMNGTRKGRLKLTPNVRYALGEHDSLVLADIPCQYVSCSADTVSSQHNFKTPVSVGSVGRARLTDDSNKKESGTDVGSEDPEAKVSSPALKDSKNTPLRNICLSFEQTPTQPQGTLVPESDLDSDEEREGRASRRQKISDSDSDLNKSSPTCSTFLSPTNKVVPESEDESPITPPISSKNRAHRHVSFNKEETNINVGRQQLKEKTASEEEDGALKGNISAGCGPHMGENQESNVSLNDETASRAAVSTHAFKMDSDTDLEGEEEGVAPAVPVTLTTNPKADRTSNGAQFHMDSDTDVEEDESASHTVPESAPPPENDAKSANLVFQPAGSPVDSDTDVEEEDAASKAKPVSTQGEAGADSAPAAHLKHFHLESSTESEGEDPKRAPSNSSLNETHPKLAEPVPAAGPRPGSETDDEAAPALGKPGAGPATDAHADLDILSDSDTDVEPDSPLVKQTFVGTNMSVTRGTKATQSDSGADTDVEGSGPAPVAEGVTAAGLHGGGEKDSGDEVNLLAPGEGQVPHLVRENTAGLYCSTPVQLPESEKNRVEDMDTQAFLSPTSGTSRAAAPALRTEAFAFDSDSQQDESIVVAETQPFVLRAGARQGSGSGGHVREAARASDPDATDDEMSKRACGEEPFQLGLSGSSLPQDPGQALAMESTQAFISVEVTPLYAATSHANQTPSVTDPELEATQAYGEEEEEEPLPERQSRENLSLEATQAYISDPYHDSEDETDDEKQAIATDETQPFYVPASAALAMAETQPMCTVEEEEEEEDIRRLVSTAGRVKVRSKVEAEGRGGLALAQTQPMCTSGESDDEDSFPGQRKRKPKQLRTEDEQTQTLTGSEQSAVERPPLLSVDESLAPRGGQARREDNSDAALPSREALPCEGAKDPAPVTSDPSTAETQLMIAGEDEESDDADSALAPRRRKAKPLQYQEDTQTQPMISGESGEDVASLPGTETTEEEPSRVLEEKANAKSALQETQLMETKPEAEAGTSSLNGKRGTRAKSRKVSTQCEEPSRRRTRGRDEALSAAARRGNSKSGGEREEEREGEEEEQSGEAGGIKSRRQRNDVEVEEKNEENVSQIQEEPSLGEGRGDADLRGKMEEERKETEQEKMTLDVKEKEEKERIEAEQAQRSRLELERAERERIERERREREEAERVQKEREDKERLEREKAEREDKERLERAKKAKIDNERKEREEKEMLESGRRKPDPQSARQEREAKVLDGMGAEERVLKEQEQEENEAKAPARARRASRRTAAAACNTEPAKASAAVAPDDDVPARRTRSRSNSSNSVSSERSASSASAPGSRGRGRGRGARRTSDPPPAAAPRSSTRRKTVAALPTQGGINDNSAAPQGRGRASRQRARGGRAEAHSVSPATSQSDPKTTTRGRKSTKAQPSRGTEEGSQQATTSRGQRRSSSNPSEPAGAGDCSNQGQHSDDEEWLQPKRNVRSRSRKAAKSEAAAAAPGSPALGSPDETKEIRKGRKRESEGASGTSSKLFKGEEREQISGEAEEAAKHQAQDEIPVQAQRRGRASLAQTKKSLSPPDSGAGAKDGKEGVVEEPVEKKGRRRPSAAQKQQEEEREGTALSVDQRVHAPEPELRTPASRKRQAPAGASPLSKTPRSSPRSPAAAARSSVVSHTYRVLFTGVVDEAGERALAPLGGSMARGVADMNCLVTDKVRRTVKFLCAVAKGIPVVTTQWLEKSGRAGSFLPPSSFIVKDLEQEKKFSFCLQESLEVASSQPLLQGYEIHVTKSVKPEPVQMKDILTCSGATFLPKMPGSHKAQTVVISCEEDWHLCAPALSASLPVVTAEFILAGILRQKLDFGAHALSPPEGRLQPAGGRARGRKRL